MSTIRGNKRIEKLGNAIAVWGGLAGMSLWIATFYLRGSFGLAELLVSLGMPVVCGAALRLLAKL